MTKGIRLTSKVARYLMLLPGLIIVALGVLMPLVFTLIMSFYKVAYPSYIPEFTIENYVRALSNPQNWQILRNTIELSLVTCLICFILAYPTAYTISFVIKNPRIKTYIMTLLLIPFLIDWSIRCIAWVPILGERGLINSLFVALGFAPQRVLLTRLGLYIIWLQTYVLFMIFPIYLAMERIPLDYIRAAQVLRASPWKYQYHIIFKLSRPGIVCGWAFVFVCTLGDYATPSLWAGGIQTLGLSVARYTLEFIWPRAAALSTFLILITLIVMIILVKWGQIMKLVGE